MNILHISDLHCGMNGNEEEFNLGEKIDEILSKFDSVFSRKYYLL